MNRLTALGVIIGVLMAIWVYVAVGVPSLHLIVWAGIVAWATFYAVGGGAVGLRKAIASNIAGNFWAAVALLLFTAIGGGHIAVLAVLFGIAVFIFCVEARFEALSFIPGAFLGAATWVGVAAAGAGSAAGALHAGDLMIPISMIVGAGLGYVSEVAAKRLATAEPAAGGGPVAAAHR